MFRLSLAGAPVGSEIASRIERIFRPGWYAAQYSDLQDLAISPESHFCRSGFAERRSPNPLFDTSWYAQTNGLPSDLPPILHYLLVGAASGKAPSPVFDVAWYRKHAVVDTTVESDLEHYLREGWRRPHSPHPLFSTAWFVGRSRKKFDGSWTPFEDFIFERWSSNVSGSPWFNLADHDRRRPDVRKAGLHPFRHWVEGGYRETTFDDWIINRSWFLKEPAGIRLDIDPYKQLASQHSLDHSTVSRDPLRRRVCRHLVERDRAFAESLASTPDGQGIWIDWEAWARRLNPRVSDEPVVSVVIPTLNHLEDVVLTIDSIDRSHDSTPLEIILVDDASSIQVAEVLAAIPSVQLVRHETNRGYAEACATGIAQARGRYLMLLNNDVEVVDGWLDSLVAVLDSDPETGAVGSMLIRPDNRLQEAGVIIWSDATGWQYGNGQSPFDPRFRTRRVVDYCSAASLLVRRSLWDRIGGFDSMFKPAYYEDSDLCMTIAQLGKKVVYEPNSIVFHNEGSSHGTSPQGLKRHQFVNQDKFRAKWAEELAKREEVPRVGPSPEMVLRAADRQQKPTVVVIDHKELTPDSDSGSLRMHRIIEEFLRRDRRVIFHGIQGVTSEAWLADAADLGVEVYGPDAPVEDVLRAHAETIEFVWISRPSTLLSFLPTLLTWAPHLTLVYDMVDAHGLRVAREALSKGKPEIALQARRERGKERAAARLADVIVTLSGADEDYITSISETTTKTVRIPNVHSSEPTATSFDDRTGLLFVGGYEHEPNVDAVRHLINDIMPLVWQRLGEVPVTLAGSNPTPEVMELASPLVSVPGWIENLRPLYECNRLVVAPLRYGAGVKGKIGEALSLGVPTVTTSIGAEGMPCVAGRDILVADDIPSFVDAIVLAYTKEGTWQGLATSGPVAIENAYGRAALTRQVDELFRAVAVSTDHSARSQTP